MNDEMPLKPNNRYETTDEEDGKPIISLWCCPNCDNLLFEEYDDTLGFEEDTEEDNKNQNGGFHSSMRQLSSWDSSPPQVQS